MDTQKHPQEDVSMEEMSIKKLFDLPLTIPDYQRIYCWDNKRITNLWNNLMEISLPEYHLGAIILHHNDNGDYDIIDGQQRLVTLTLMLRALGEDSNKLPLLKATFKSSEACDNVANSMYVIENLKNKYNYEKEFKSKIKEKFIFSVLILQNANLDLAYTFFSNQNSRGVELSDFDILKAHHLRYLVVPEQAEHLAQKWDLLSQEVENEKTSLLERALGLHLFRLRKWMRKRPCDEAIDRPIKEEFSAAPTMTAIPPFGERFYFYEKIQGGSHFFAYTEIFVEHYRKFIGLPQVKLLRWYLLGESHWKYESVIETLLFGYYTKFGTAYLTEALFCIASIMAQHRYEKRAIQHKINEFAKDSEIVMMIDQATSPTFFIAEAIPHITQSGRGKEKIAGRFYNQLSKVFQAVLAAKESFSSVDDRRLALVSNVNVKQIIEKEYGKQ